MDGPSTPATVAPANCGNGRRACASVWFAGKPGYGLLKPRATTAGDEIVEPSNVRSAGLLISRPNAPKRCGVLALRLSIPGACHQIPRLPTYVRSTTRS